MSVSPLQISTFKPPNSQSSFVKPKKKVIFSVQSYLYLFYSKIVCDAVDWGQTAFFSPSKNSNDFS